MKEFLKKVLPPQLVRLTKREYSQTSDKRPRKYDTYEAALADCNADAYENDDIVRAVVEKNVRLRSSIEETKRLDLGALRTLIGIGLAKVGAEQKLNVIDFGGGGGYHYTIAKAALGNDFKLRWNVVETPAMTREAQRMRNSELRFFDCIESASKDLGGVDLVFTSGALQYCPDPLNILKELVRVRADYLFITRTALNDEPNRLIIVQNSPLSHNGPGALPPGFVDRTVSYPAVFCPKQDFESVIAQHYQIRFCITEDKAAYLAADKGVDMFGYFCVLASNA